MVLKSGNRVGIAGQDLWDRTSPVGQVEWPVCGGKVIATQMEMIGGLEMPRDTYKYHFKKGNKIVHTGIANDLDRREQEHKQTHGNSGHIKQVGRASTRDAA